MLPDFTKARKVIRQKLNEFFKERTTYHSPGMNEISERIIHEGTGTTTINADSDFQHEMELKPHQSETSVKIDELLSDPYKAFEIMDLMSIQMAAQKSKAVYDAVSEVTERTGNVSKRKGPVTPEVIFEMYGKIQISFDTDGQALMPSIHAGPQMVAEIQNALTKIQNNPELSKKFSELINHKKQEWNDRENNRKLVG